VDLSKFLLPHRKTELLSPGLWSTLAPEDRPDDYDKMARAYDWLVGNSLYNRIVWGSWASTYAEAARREIASATSGTIIDVGCGSLVFTAKPYQSAPLDRTILFDRSLGMMKRGKARLQGGQFVQGDAFDMPFKDASFNIVLAWGFLHVVGSKSPLLSEIRRIAMPAAKVSLSTLVLSNRRNGDRILQLGKGEAAEPETADQVVSAFEKHFIVTRKTQKGSMLFLNGRADD
jgi:ubiquinone/menaquinone biosynthesis C-methylase UbiE